MKHLTILSTLLLINCIACDDVCPSPGTTTGPATESGSTDDTTDGDLCPAAEQCDATAWGDFCGGVQHLATSGILLAVDTVVVTAQCESEAQHCDVCKTLHDLCISGGLQSPDVCDAAESQCNCYGNVYGVPVAQNDGRDLAAAGRPAMTWPHDAIQLEVDIKSPLLVAPAIDCFATDEHPASVIYRDEFDDAGDDQKFIDVRIVSSGHEDRAACWRGYLQGLGAEVSL